MECVCQEVEAAELHGEFKIRPIRETALEEAVRQEKRTLMKQTFAEWRSNGYSICDEETKQYKWNDRWYKLTEADIYQMKVDQVWEPMYDILYEATPKTHGGKSSKSRDYDQRRFQWQMKAVVRSFQIRERLINRGEQREEARWKACGFLKIPLQSSSAASSLLATSKCGGFSLFMVGTPSQTS